MKNYFIADKSFTQQELEAHCREKIISTEPWEKDNYSLILDWFSDSDSIELQTSGSTGESRKIRMSKAAMTASAQLTATHFRLGPQTRALLCIPSAYIGGKMVIIRSLVNEWILHWTKPVSNPLGSFESAVDIASFTPMQVRAIIENHSDQLKNIPTVLIGGGAISDGLERQLRHFPNHIYATYGMTETISHVAVRPLTGAKASNFFRALPGVRFSQNEKCCLIVESAHLEGMRVETNDLVQLTSPYTFQFLGRADNVINSGGIKLFPEKIEEKISQLIDRDFFLIKEPDDVLGERMVMYVEGEDYNDSDLLRLRSSMKLLLNGHEMPKDIRFREKFERTPTDKIKRRNY